MRWLLILPLISPVAMAAHPKLSLGAGYEARVDHDVNPDYDQVNAMGEIFATLAFHPFSALLEVDNNQKNSGDGNYTIRTSTFNPMIWGRFEPWPRFRVSPYAGLGFGWTFANVVTNFGTAHDDRWIDGGAMFGGALGLMADFWRHWKVEGEVRIVKTEFQIEPIDSFVLRSGYTF